MTTPSDELLRRLLPSYYWLRDAESGEGTLAALVRSLAEQYDELRLDLDRLYDDLFIETCGPAQVPLIGDGVGLLGLAPDAGPGVGDRAWVGRIVGLRRRKGMLATIARGVTAATGWAAYVQEGRTVTATTHSVRDTGDPGGFAEVSGRRPAARLREPWSTVPRSASISGHAVLAGEPAPPVMPARAGYPAPAAVAVSVWRLQSYWVARRSARPAGLASRAFHLDPLGRDVQLFAPPSAPADPQLAPGPSELPLPLTVDRLREALEGRPPVVLGGCGRIVAGDLANWEGALGEADAIVDPVRGRALLAEPRLALDVSYAYGFPGELGGGPYGTAGDYRTVRPGARELRVTRGVVDALAGALAEARDHDADIVIEDSGTYLADAGAWRVEVARDRVVRLASAPAAAPLLDGDLHVRIEHGGRLELSGFTLNGSLSVEGEGELAVEHCTLAPRETSLRAGSDVAVVLSHTILGGVMGVHLALRTTIVDGRLEAAGTADLDRVTALGPVDAAVLLARDCLFTRPVLAGAGVVETSYLPDGSRVPQTFGCTGPAAGEVRLESTRWGDAAYCRLRLDCPSTIAGGGGQGGELGVYNWLGQPQRFARLPGLLGELLPAGIGASVHYVT
ncbi:hypothetical protein [Solirubrobacter soli]|uniref:hypothetical protein n=1 Tax=Solirubrobacter soli TaxID=363832 RepID=UPI00041264E1|nr:hypothetical protein [Solirubrobacter soli]